MKKNKSRNRRIDQKKLAIFLLIGLVLILIGISTFLIRNRSADKKVQMPELDVELLTINEFSRPGLAIDQVNAIVIHYTANPGTDAIDNRNYFEGLKDSQATHASAHFIVGLDGTIVQCIPTTELAYATSDRNTDTISIECCHEDETGAFNQNTYDALVELTAFLVTKFDLSSDDIIRHYDVTGKACPLYYVEHEDAWEQFRADVMIYIDEHGVNPSQLEDE